MDLIPFDPRLEERKCAARILAVGGTPEFALWWLDQVVTRTRSQLTALSDAWTCGEELLDLNPDGSINWNWS
jgi:hypothetical protein